jgi:S1-C subfamily serine protease
MARFWCVVLCLVISAILYFCLAWQAPKKRDAFALSTVMVRSGGGHGSGVQVVPGFFLTAAHVLHGEAKVVTSKGMEVAAEVLWISKEYDIALLRADVPDAGVSPLNCSAARTGLSVKAIGNPGPFEFVHSWGHISNAESQERGAWKSTIIVDVSAGPGSSGGPIFDMKGGVVGIVVAYAPQIPGFMLVVPSAAVCSLVLRHPANNA